MHGGDTYAKAWGQGQLCLDAMMQWGSGVRKQGNPCANYTAGMPWVLILAGNLHVPVTKEDTYILTQGREPGVNYIEGTQTC